MEEQARLQKGCLRKGGRCSRKGCESPEVDPCASGKECPQLQKGVVRKRQRLGPKHSLSSPGFSGPMSSVVAYLSLLSLQS